MPLFAPGAWAGVNDSFLIARQREQEQQRIAEGQQRMKRDAYDMMTTQQDRMRSDHARMRAGNSFYNLVPPEPGQNSGPPPGTGIPPPGTGTPPPPGGGMAPPGGGMAPPGGGMAPPGGPQVGAPQGPPRMPQGMALPPMGGGIPPPGQRSPMPNFPPPDAGQLQNEQVERTQKYIADIQQEMRRPGIPGDTTTILRAELAKSQDQLSKLTGQPAPYRTVPDGSEQPAPAAQDQMAPPPVAKPQQQGGGMLMQIVRQAKADGVPPEELTDFIAKMEPGLKMQMGEEMATMRAGVAEANMQIKAIMAGLAANKETRQAAEGDKNAESRRIAAEASRTRAATDAGVGGGVATGQSTDSVKEGSASLLAGVPKAQIISSYGKQAGAKWDAIRHDAFGQLMKTQMTRQQAAGVISENGLDRVALGKALTQQAAVVAGTDRLSKVVYGQIDLLTKELDRSGLNTAKFTNVPYNKLRSMLSNPDLAKVDVYMAGLAREVQKLNTAVASNAQLHISASAVYDKLINRDMSITEAKSAVDAFKKEMEVVNAASLQTVGDLRKGITDIGASGKGSDTSAKSDGNTNAKGWTLHTDKNGNKAYVSPDGKQFEEMK